MSGHAAAQDTAARENLERHAAEFGDQAHPDAVALAVDMLIGELTERGLPARQLGTSVVWLTSRQSVQCRMDAEGRFGWFWVSHTPGVPPTNPFALVSELELAVGLISLAVLYGERPGAVS